MKMGVKVIAAILGFFIWVLPAGALVFDTTEPKNDLEGEFEAEVKFAQSQTIPACPEPGDRQPHLIGQRSALLLVRPLVVDDETPLQVSVFDKKGNLLKEMVMETPEHLPMTAYHEEGVSSELVNFEPLSDSVSVVNKSSFLQKLKEEKSKYLKSLIEKSDLVKISMADERWVDKIYLPEEVSQEGKVVEVQSEAEGESQVHYSGKSVKISLGTSLRFQYVAGRWVQREEVELSDLRYAEHMWSGELPGEIIRPGVRFVFRQGERSGELREVPVGAASELLIHTIDMGVFTPPRGEFTFAGDAELQREYFHTAPVSRFIVSNYAPLHLEEVMLPDGTLLRDSDPGEGGVYTGTLRETIGKELVSLGINNANYGLNDTPARGPHTNPYLAAQLTAHNNRGKYANGVQVHGLSGGGGIVTLLGSVGNEFSHEVGHNYGLGHYVDGFKGSVHRGPEGVNSAWGWDRDKHRFIPNFYPTPGRGNTCLENECEEPFAGKYSYGMDAMAGGGAFSDFNRYTMYTPNSAALIQEFLEKKVVFDESSATGFRKWDAEKREMLPWKNLITLSLEASASLEELEKGRLGTLFEKNDLVEVKLWDGHWTKKIRVPRASSVRKGSGLRVEHKAGYSSMLFLNGKWQEINRGFTASYVSDGKEWVEGEFESRVITRVPQAFGVPVVTVLGYHDPEGNLPSYLFPALHGGFGYCYSPDGEEHGSDGVELEKGDSYLLVQTKLGKLQYRLSPNRLEEGIMNKVHVNIPASFKPSGIALVRAGRVVMKRKVEYPKETPGFRVHGGDLN